jgi:predicted outer membrane repeat protein
MKRFVLFIGFLGIGLTGQLQNVWFVDMSSTGSQTGQTWSSAFVNLQHAIDTAASGDTILVAKGTYYPSTIAGGGTHVRDKAFVLKPHSRIFGGFDGTESGLTDRDNDSASLHITNRTILSGNIGNVNNDEDNTYHVVLSLNGNYNGQVDGFDIVDGYADSTSTHTIGGFNVYRNVGAGINTWNSNATFSNCVIKDNVAKRGGAGVNNSGGGPYFEWCAIEENMVSGTFNQDPNGGGGGMRNDNCDASITDSRFFSNESFTNQGGGAIRNENGSDAYITDVIIKDNYCEDGDGGGGVYNYYNSAPTLTNVSFISNSTENQGGAMYSDGSIPVATNCLFYDNFAEGGSGALECDGQSNVVLNDCEFIDNSTEGDGGAIQSWQSSIEVNNCLFEGNHADGDGGAIYNYNMCSPWITNTIIRSNTCDGNGGGMYNRRNCNPVLTHLLVYDNYAGINGGGIYTITSNGEPCSPIATNVTIVRNEASNSGGGAYDDGLGNSRLKNSIILGNTALSNDEVDAPAASAITNLFYCIIGNEYYTFGTNPPTVYSGAVFFDPTNDDFHLSPNSPGLDVGDSVFFAGSATPDLSSITEDLDGNPRVMGANIDLGAYEVCTDTLSPTVSISVSPTDSVQDSTVTTFTSTTNVSNVIQYQWYKNSNAIAGETTDTYIAIADVDYISGDDISLSILSNDQCSEPNAITFSNEIVMIVYTIADTTDTTVVDTTVGINGLELETAFQIFPNPVHSGFVSIQGYFPLGSNIALYDQSGRIVLQATTNGALTQLDVSMLEAGVYVVSVASASGFKAEKLLLIAR